MSISLTNLRRRLVTVLVPEGSSTRAVRIASMQTAKGLPDAVLDLPAVQQGLRSGELEAERDASAVAAPTKGESARTRKVKGDG